MHDAPAGMARSEDALLIFDGDCSFCTRAVSVMRRALAAPPRATPYQWADLGGLGLTEAEASDRMWLIVSGRRYGGHLAVSAILRRQPHLGLRFLGQLLETPPFSLVAAAVYRLFARLRARLPGGTAACAKRPPSR